MAVLPSKSFAYPGARLLVMGVLVLVSCGKRGDPLPPLRLFPEAAEGIRVWQRGPFVHLEWRAPSRNTDGSTDVALQEAVILRRVAEIPDATAPAETPDSVAGAETDVVKETVTDEKRPATESEAVAVETPAEAKAGEPAEKEDVAQATPSSGGRPASAVPPPFPQGAEEIATLEAKESGGLLTFRDPWDPSWEGKRLEYAVRHVNREGRPGRLSLIVSIDPVPPPAPPRDLSVAVEDGLARLHWTGPGVDTGGEGAFGYNVFRRSPPDAFPSSPLNQETLTESMYEDRSVLFGQPWCYIVRRVFVSEPSSAQDAGGVPPSLIESADSNEICVTPIDSFPPPPPEDVVAIPSSEGILVSWATVLAPDLRGYLVYRATGTEETFELLTVEPLTPASFTDTRVEPGVLYVYAVTAVDRAEPWNESPRSRVVSVQVPEIR